MRPLLVIIPSRGRPCNIDELLTAWEQTSDDRASLLIALDYDDETFPEYELAIKEHNVPAMLTRAERNGFAPRLNYEANLWAPIYPMLASWGDDHRPRTEHWDTKLIDALTELKTGVAYSNDLVHGEAIPTAWAQTSDIVRALGWMVPPGLKHLYVDNAAKNIGQGLQSIRYLDAVHIEHVHPITGKAEWDDLYREGNSAEVEHEDFITYGRWLAQIEADLRKIRTATR